MSRPFFELRGQMDAVARQRVEARVQQHIQETQPKVERMFWIALWVVLSTSGFLAGWFAAELVK